MLNILFDHQTFSMQYYGGISRYFANIQHTIEQQNDVRSDISILRSNNHYIQDFPAPLNNALGKILLNKQKRCFKWNKLYSSYRLKKNDYDVLHPTYYNPYFLKYTRKPYVITVHDMIHELYPEFFEPGDEFVKYKRLCVENAAHIIAISSSTKEDLKNILGIDDSRISVVHHGYSPELSVSANLQQPTQTSDYLLYVGDRRGYKNFSRFVTAIVPLLEKNSSIKLICAGGGPLQSAEQELLLRLKIQSRVMQASVSDSELSALYRGAMAFIYPSLYEGFGLPILEAFQNKCPIIASDNACFREIGKDALAYFDPLDMHNMLITIERVIDSKKEKETLVEKGLQLLQNFSMDDCMNKTIAVYRNTAK
jgi:glycosyltransferase involved in cell wall biosynthesis